MTPKLKRADSGETLVEVIVAAVIMGLLGLTIVGAIIASRPIADKINSAGLTMANLSSAAEQIRLQPFQACSPTAPQPYALSTTALQATNASSTGLAITTNSLPLGQAPSSGLTYPYSATLAATGVGTNFLWSVSPALPGGLTLSSGGVISGTPTAESSKSYKFTLTSGGTSVTQDLTLTIVTILVQVNDASGAAWVACQTVPKATITGAVASGSLITYTYSAASAFAAGNIVTISGVTPAAFNLVSATIISATATQFTIASTATGAYGSGGLAGLTKNVNVQQIIISTSIGTRKYTQTIAVAI